MNTLRLSLLCLLAIAATTSLADPPADADAIMGSAGGSTSSTGGLPNMPELQDDWHGQPPVCTDAWLLLSFDYKTLNTSSAARCKACGENSEVCVLDWPSSDVTSCEVYDTLRNSIFGAYGREFTTPKWQTYFKSLKWYDPNSSYSDAMLSARAKRNIATIKTLRDGLAKTPQGKQDPSCL